MQTLLDYGIGRTTMMTFALKAELVMLYALALRWNCTLQNGIEIFSIVNDNDRLVAIQMILASYLYWST